MRLLLDTNALLWWRAEDARLSARAADQIRDPNNDIVVSVAVLWEIAIKCRLGKLRFLEDFEAVMVEEDFHLRPIAYRDLRTLESLPPHHRDPFDRLLIAQAIAEGSPIVTEDRMFAAYGVPIVW